MLFMWPHMQGILQMELKANIYAQLLKIFFVKLIMREK